MGEADRWVTYIMVMYWHSFIHSYTTIPWTVKGTILIPHLAWSMLSNGCGKPFCAKSELCVIHSHGVSRNNSAAVGAALVCSFARMLSEARVPATSLRRLWQMEAYHRSRPVRQAPTPAAA